MFVQAEHSRELTPELLQERRELCATQGVTLNGHKAMIMGSRDPFAMVITIRDGLSAQWSWETVKRVVAADKAFKS